MMNGALMMVVRSGLAALWPALLPDGGVRARLPVADVPAYNAALVASTKHLAAAAAELRDLEQSHAQMRSAQITTLGDIPLVVLRHGAGQPMMASPEVVAALEETFARLQAEMAALSTNGRLVVAEQGGHAIHLDQPELVVEAIRGVVAAARARPRPVRTVSHSQVSSA
ncbi:MAG: hypothetical protein R3248_01655 [Candidatus Promineifilaceae bacterium]|nr:hypothetical protein [Candidatus Promineifilaceae bacterium]